MAQLDPAVYRDPDKFRPDAVLTSAIEFDWSTVFEDEGWELVPPVPDTVDEARMFLDQIGESYTDLPPFNMNRDARARALKAVGETDEALKDYSDRSLLHLLVEAIDDGQRSGLGLWKERCEDAASQAHERWTPVMMYYYLLPSYDPTRDGHDQLLLELYGGSLCLAKIKDQHVLALTGAGMDLSAEICAAYMLLGYLPPLTFCRDLPYLAGESARLAWWEWLLRGARRTCQVAETACRTARASLQDLEKRLIRETRRKVKT